MDRKYIDDRHIIARYLADQLSDEESAAFEAYYLEHPEVVQEMEITARFKNGFTTLERRQELEPLLNAAPRPIFSLRLVAGLAAVAVAAVLATIALTSLDTRVLGSSVVDISSRFGAQLPTSATYDLIRVRGAPTDQRVVLPTEPSALRFRIVPDEEGATYRLTLRNAQNDQEIAKLDSLAPDEDQLMTVFVNSAKLSPGLYELTATPVDAPDDQAIAFTIEAVTEKVDR